LYFLEKLVAESRPGRIKYDSEVVRLVILDESPQDISEKKGHVRGDAAGAGEPLRHWRKESAIDMRHRIHEK